MPWIQVVLSMFAQDTATPQPPRTWRLHLLMALNSWTIFSERSLDAKHELLLPTQKTNADSEKHMVCRYSVEPAATCFNLSTWIEYDDCDLHYASIVQLEPLCGHHSNEHPKALLQMCCHCVNVFCSIYISRHYVF